MPTATETVDLRALAALDDPDGVLSILVDADPTDQGDPYPAWAEHVRTELARLRADDRRNGGKLRDRLSRLEDELARLLDARAPGRGRALYVPLSDGRGLVSVELQLPLPNVFRIARRPHLRPLVRVLQEAEPTAFACASRDGVRVVEWYAGQTQDLADHPFTSDASEWRDLRGPAQTNPTLTGESVGQRDLFERRLETHRLRFLDDVAADLARLGAERAWQELVVAGDSRLTGPLTTRLSRQPGAPRTIVAPGPAAGEWRDSQSLAQALLPHAAEERARRAAELARKAADAAATGGRGALGPADVLAALEQGRVHHLLLDADLAVSGARAPSGTLEPEIAGGPEGDNEPDLGDLAIALAVATDTGLTVATGELARILDPLGGMAAILRW